MQPYKGPNDLYADLQFQSLFLWIFQCNHELGHIIAVYLVNVSILIFVDISMQHDVSFIKNKLDTSFNPYFCGYFNATQINVRYGKK